jgi:hypothetical protein
MNKSLPQADATDMSALLRIDGLRDLFEQSWRKGERPRIEDYLEKAPEAERPALLRRLLMKELELRSKAGGGFSCNEYYQRFQAYPDLLPEVERSMKDWFYDRIKDLPAMRSTVDEAASSFSTLPPTTCQDASPASTETPWEKEMAQ